MSNNYFQFKKFLVYQDLCSMKVCTDACILGAWAAQKIKNNFPGTAKVLDIGTGTGLLSLMIAQNSSAIINAIEIDENAFKQARDNFSKSPWSERLQVFHADAKDYFDGIKYDFIISNPPFYQDDLLSPATIKNIAKHDEGLRFDELILTFKKSLHGSGSFAVLLPFFRIDYFENVATQNNFFLKEKLLLRSTPKHNYSRGVLLFSQTKTLPLIKELVIKKDENYTPGFMSLMKDYYLNL